MVHDAPEEGLEVVSRAEAGGVEKVDGAWAGDSIEGEAKDKDDRAGEEVVLEVEPQVAEVNGLRDLVSVTRIKGTKNRVTRLEIK